MKRLIPFTLLCCTLLLAACSGGVDNDAIATIVAATLQAEASAQAAVEAAPVEETQPTTGTIEGNMCYPSEGIPPMTLYLQEQDTAEPVQVPIAQNQSTYSAEVPAGSYTAFAWLPDFVIGGSYSQFVACGLSVDCSDHSLIQFQVDAGQTTSGIDVCDWYGGPSDVPLPPGVEAPTGSISGSLSYPSSFIPSLNVIAYSVENNTWYMVITNENDSTYQIDDLPVGTYYIVAYVAGDNYGGGYTQAVPCGLSVECSDHSLIPVAVNSNSETSGIDPGDWYAPEGSFPANPNN